MANLSKADLTALTQGIGSMLVDVLDKKLGAPTQAPVVSEEVEYTDPVSQKLDEGEAQLVEQLTNPVHKIVRGRKGATLIDVTAESIAQLQDLRNNRKKWRTQTNIR